MNKMYSVSQAGLPSHAENPTARGRCIHQVVDVDGNIVNTFRNEVLANRMVKADSTLRVRSFSL